jgi:hypothetical protein
VAQTTDFLLDDGTGLQLQAQLHEIFAALASSNAGPTAPANPLAGMVWLDTSASPVAWKIRDAANANWREVVAFDGGVLRIGTLQVNGVLTALATGGEGGEVRLRNPDNATSGLLIDVLSADLGRVFQNRNNSVLEIGQVSGTGGIIKFLTAGAERARIDAAGNFRFNSGYGSVATAYGCRAWVAFDGANGNIAASGNVSSVSRTGTGSYTINFSTAMPNVNYAVAAISGQNETALAQVNTGSVLITTRNASGTLTDGGRVCVTIHR